jgi:hypothetical protein
VTHMREAGLRPFRTQSAPSLRQVGMNQQGSWTHLQFSTSYLHGPEAPPFQVERQSRAGWRCGVRVDEGPRG